MRKKPFYLRTNNPNIITENMIEEFSAKNSIIGKFIKENNLKIELRLLDLNFFESFSYWIIGQQISVSAADAIIERYKTLLKDISAERYLTIDSKSLRNCGLSVSKIEYIRNVAKFYLDHKDDTIITNPAVHTTEELHKQYRSIKGVGPWTVNMHLIFVIGKLDIFAYNDLGVRKGIQKIYRLDDIPNITYFRKLADKFNNLGTIASLTSWAALGE